MQHSLSHYGEMPTSQWVGAKGIGSIKLRNCDRWYHILDTKPEVFKNMGRDQWLAEADLFRAQNLKVEQFIQELEKLPSLDPEQAYCLKMLKMELDVGTTLESFFRNQADSMGVRTFSATWLKISYGALIPATIMVSAAALLTGFLGCRHFARKTSFFN